MTRSESRRSQHGQWRQDSQENRLEEDIAWTTARCNRLLRTINSRIEAIRGLMRPDLRFDKNASKLETKPRKPKQPESVTDPAWLPNGLKRPTLRTYAAKRRPKVARDVRSDKNNGGNQLQKITLPSPFLRRVGSSDSAPSAGGESPGTKDDQQPRQRQRQFYTQFVRVEDPLEKVELALHGAFRSFLNTTRPEEVRKRRGTSSLLNTCLHQVPQYLDTFTTSLEDDHGNNVEDDATEIWSFFDDLLEIKGASWQGLREVVRSQGINAIGRAIIDGTLRDDCVATLITSCQGNATTPIVETFLHAWFERCQAITSVHIWALNRATRDHDAEGISFRVLRRFVEQDSRRLTSLLNANLGIWNNLLRAVTTGAQIDALDFLQACIEHRMSSNDRSRPATLVEEQLERNLAEVASKLWVMSFTSLLIDKVNVQGAQLQGALFQLAVHFSTADAKAVAKLGASWALAPVVLTELMGGPPSVATGSDALSKVYEQVARNPFHSRAAKRAEQDFATRVATDLCSLHTSEGNTTMVWALLVMRQHIEKNPRTVAADVLRHIFTEVVTHCRTEDIQFSSPVGDNLPAYLARPASMEKMADFPQTPKAKVTNFGWDDDLCEWIARTPFTQPPPEDFSTGIGTEMPGKENVEPETPDVLAESIVKTQAIRKLPDTPPSWRRSPAFSKRSLSPQVVISRPAKRRISNRTQVRQWEDESEDELAM